MSNVLSAKTIRVQCLKNYVHIMFFSKVWHLWSYQDILLFIDPSIRRDPKDALGVVGQVLSLQCIVIGNPAIKVSWEKDGNALDIQGDNQKVVNVQQWDKSSKLYTLKINRAKASDAGKYKCVVVNGNVRKASKEAVVSFTGIIISYRWISSLFQAL
jgi:hypothetical protein